MWKAAKNNNFTSKKCVYAIWRYYPFVSQFRVPAGVADQIPPFLIYHYHGHNTVEVVVSNSNLTITKSLDASWTQCWG